MCLSFQMTDTPCVLLKIRIHGKHVILLKKKSKGHNTFALYFFFVSNNKSKMFRLELQKAHKISKASVISKALLNTYLIQQNSDNQNYHTYLFKEEVVFIQLHFNQRVTRTFILTFWKIACFTITKAYDPCCTF